MQSPEGNYWFSFNGDLSNLNRTDGLLFKPPSGVLIFSEPDAMVTDDCQAPKRIIDFLVDLNNNSVSRRTHSIHGQSWEVYRACKYARNRTQQCLKLLEAVCQRASHIVTKVLRMDFSYTQQSLLNNPRLKAILLLRDPRGILNSHIRTTWYPLKNHTGMRVEEDAKVICSRIQRDVKAAKELMSRFPDRVKIVQYEDLGEAGRNLKPLYTYLGMKAPPMSDNTKSSNPKTSGNGHDLFSYRTSMAWDTVKVLDKHCSDVYRELGLVQYEDEAHLRNLTRSPIISTLPYSLEN